MYRFACFTLDSRRSVLFAGGRPVALARKVVDTLSVLVEHAGGVASKDEIIQRLWPDGFVEESNLTQNVYLLRQAFREHGIEHAIETVPRRGYRFALPVNRGEPPLALPTRRTPTRPFAAAVIVFFLAFAAGGFDSSNGAQHDPARASAHAELERLSPADAQAYGLGRYAWSLRTVSGLRRSIEYFSRVARDNPASALGFAGLSDAYLGLYDYQCESRGCPAFVERATRAAAAAIAANPSSAEALTSQAMVLHVFVRDDRGAAAEFERAIAADPRYAPAHEWYGNLLLVNGSIAAARRELEAAASLDPVSPATYGWLARAAYLERDYRSAISYAQRGLTISPDRFETRVLLGVAFEQNGDVERALTIFGQLDQTGSSEATRALLAGAYARSGRRLAAEKMLAPLDPSDGEVAFGYAALHKYGVARADVRKVKFRNGLERAFFSMDPRLDAIRLTDPAAIATGAATRR